MPNIDLEKIPVLLEQIKSEIAINEVHLSNKVDQTEFIKSMADIKEIIRKEYEDRINKLLLKVIVAAGITGGGTGWLF